ncbi:unnamed protein product [Paramecium primaurelia]|uniref:WD40-repeat-containing domain n=1 Tax=Paramecium primaurelia TaxID=5886 RepID=A0A8S1MS52_PARPR|nr:unnamed protein product [Paramecium primaurelia]
MELIKIEDKFNNYKQHILELEDNIYIITTTLDFKGHVQLSQFVINYKTKEMLQKKQLNIQFKMSLFIQTSMSGYYTINGLLGCLIGIHNGRLFQIRDNKVDEICISAMAINQIELISDSLALLSSESGQINLYDIYTQTTIFLFNEYLSTPLKYFRIRYFYDTIVQGKQDGQMTYFIFNENMKQILANRDKNIQMNKFVQYQNILISQPNCRLYVTGQKLLDFELYGDVMIILVEHQIEYLLIDVKNQEYIRLRVFQITHNITSFQVCNDSLILYNESNVFSMDMNKGEIRNQLDQKGTFMNLLTYVKDNKILYK